MSDEQSNKQSKQPYPSGAVETVEFDKFGDPMKAGRLFDFVQV